MVSSSKKRLKRLNTVLLLLVSAFTLTGFGCRPAKPANQSDTPLLVWGLWQDSDEIDPLAKAFQEKTGVEIEYKKIASVADYERILLSALAENRGPDVFVIHHTWVENRRRLMTPAPAEVIDERAIREEFVDVAGSDLVREGLVYALPVSVDTLALYYNKDLLAAAGVARPPTTWDEFQHAVQRMTKIDRSGAILQSAAAIGTAANINRASDLVQLLMMQSGMSIADGEQKFDLANDTGQRSLTFYTDFANRGKRTYTWDLQQDYSIDAFAEGEVAMLFNYSYHIETLRAKNPRLNFGIAPMPQITDTKSKINFAAYWPFAVANTSHNPLAAWQFIRFLTETDNATPINKPHNAPPARREAVLQLQRDPLLGVFAEQALSAVTWPRGDITVSDKIFNDMVDSVVTGEATVADALRRAEDQLKQFEETRNDKKTF